MEELAEEEEEDEEDGDEEGEGAAMDQIAGMISCLNVEQLKAVCRAKGLRVSTRAKHGERRMRQ